MSSTPVSPRSHFSLPSRSSVAVRSSTTGPALVRQKRLGEALTELKEAARLAPDHARYAYVYGIALHGTGKQAEGIRVLAEAHRHFTGDAEILLALAAMERDRGKRDAARGYARKLDEISPDDPQARALLKELSR